jgi:excisionase family DNA binding protein
VTVDEAARHLGLTVDAVRKRVQRDQIPHEKDAAGRVRIILDDVETLQDERPDTAGQSNELVEELRDRLRFVERQLEEEREARTEERRRHDTLMAQLMQRIPEIEAPREARESPEKPSEGAEPGSSTGGPQEGTERPPDTAEWPVRGSLHRPWWRRVFSR